MSSTNHLSKTLEDECSRLKRTVEELQCAQAQDRETIRTLRDERDRYLQALYAWSRAQVSQEELHRWAVQEETGETLAEVLAELKSSKAP
jgi:hypothetical protein